MKTKNRKRHNKRRVKAVRSVNHHSIGKEYTEYKKKIPKKSHLGGREEIREFSKAFFEKVADALIETEGGVYIRGLGYFFVWLIPRKIAFDKYIGGEYLGSGYNYHTDMHPISPMFYPQYPQFAYFSMDNTFSDRVKKGVSRNVFKGKKYKMYLSTLKRPLSKYHR